MSIKEVLNNSLQTETSDIADGAGLYVGTNPPRELNIAMAISGGRTTNIAEALDIHYGNTEPSFTISKAIATGAGTDDPTKSIEDVMSEMIDKDEYYTVKFDADGKGEFRLWPKSAEEDDENPEPLDVKEVITFKIPKEVGVFPRRPQAGDVLPDLSVGGNEWDFVGNDGSLMGYSITPIYDVEAGYVHFPYTLTEDVTFYAQLTYK